MSFVKEGLLLNSDPVHCVYAPTFTNYLYLSGDMSPVTALDFGRGVVIGFDLNNYLSQAQIDDFKARAQRMPRPHFNEMIKSIVNTLTDPDIQEAVATNLLELFNVVNQETIAQNNMINWDYEQFKMEAIYRAEAEKEIGALELDSLTVEAFSRQADLDLKSELEARYVLLPKLKDEAMQLQRSLAFKLLLDKGSFATVKMALDFYETLSDDCKQMINA